MSELALKLIREAKGNVGQCPTNSKSETVSHKFC